MTAASVHARLIMSGKCWSCHTTLIPIDGWNACPDCDRRFAFEGDRIREAIPLPAEALLRTGWDGPDPLPIELNDGSMVYLNKPGPIPLDARAIHYWWP